MSLTFKDYKINHIALLFIKVLTLSQKQVKIQNSVPSIGRTYYSIDWEMKKSSPCFCLVRLILDSCSIDQNQHSIGRKEFLIDWDSHNWIFQNFPRTIFYVFIVFNQNTFWFYQWRFTDQTLGYSISRSRTIIMLETLKT